MPKRPSKGSAASKRRLTFWKTALSVDQISQALKITPADALAKFQDGRVTSWFAEIWGERLFKYTKHLNTNYPGSDASIDLGAMGPFEISVRSLTTAGIRFQKSANIGSGRKASQDDVDDAVASVERVVVVDIRDFPNLTFIPLDSKWLLQQAHRGVLTARGLRPGQFYDLLKSEFALEEKPFDLSMALTSSSLASDGDFRLQFDKDTIPSD
jgi:hypothetical protein